MTVDARIRIKIASTVWTTRRPRIKSKERDGVEDMAAVTAVVMLVKVSRLANLVILHLSGCDRG